MARVIYFSRDYTPHDHRFLTALADSGHQVFYLRLEKQPYAVEERPLPPKVEKITWFGGRHPARLRSAWKFFQEVKQVIARVDPEVILAGPIQSGAFLVALSGFKKLVTISWGYDLLLDANKNWLADWITRYTLTRSSVMVGDCETIRRLAIRFGMPPERIVIFPYGVNLQKFSPSESKTKNPHQFNILSTRTWEPVYGVDLIAKAFIRLAHEHPGASLTMLGHGTLKKELLASFTQAGVLDRVVFPGHIPQAELAHFYHEADVYVSASHSDGTSISLLEAMACGRPAIVSDIPGNREWVTDEVNGWLFRDGNADGLAEKMELAIQNRASLPGMGMEGRKRVEARADWNASVQKLNQAIELALT